MTLTADAYTYRIGRKILAPGTRVRITGARGVFEFVKATTARNGAVSLDFIGGPSGHYTWRSFRPERVKRVLGTSRNQTTDILDTAPASSK